MDVGYNEVQKWQVRDRQNTHMYLITNLVELVRDFRFIKEKNFWPGLF